MGTNLVKGTPGQTVSVPEPDVQVETAESGGMGIHALPWTERQALA